MSQFRTRTRGPDITKEQPVAVDKSADGVQWETVGYSLNMEDANEYIRRASDEKSHKEFFQRTLGDKPFSRSGAEESSIILASQHMGDAMAEEDPREARQSMRRIDALTRLFEQSLAARVAPGSGPNLMYVDWEEFQTMHTEYQDAVKSNEHRDFPFQPLSAYAHKLQQAKRTIRPIFKGECGVWTDRNGTGRVCILKDKGPGDLGEKYFQVPDNISKS